MTDEENLLDLFTHPGWKLVTQMQQDAYNVLVETAWTLKDEKALYQRKGEIQQLGSFLSLEGMTKAQAEERDDRETV